MHLISLGYVYEVFLVMDIILKWGRLLILIKSEFSSLFTPEINQFLHCVGNNT